MRIALFRGGDDGAEYVDELSGALRRHGDDVRVYGGAADAPDAALRAALRYGTQVADGWQADGWLPDVVHADSGIGGLAALAATSRVPAPVVHTYTEASGADAEATRRRLGVQRTVGTRADRVIAGGRYAEARLAALGVPRRHIRIVPPGVDTAVFTPTGPAVDDGGERPRIVSVGRPGPASGFADLVRLLPLVPDAELVVIRALGAGDEPAAGALAALAAEVGVADRFRLVGPVAPAELAAWYRSATVYCCAARADPAGSAVVEAMACGLPVVTYAAGAPAEAVLDQVTGLLVPAGRPRVLARALRRLVADATARMALGMAAADRARVRYGWDQTAAEIRRVYAEVHPAAGLAAAGG